MKPVKKLFKLMNTKLWLLAFMLLQMPIAQADGLGGAAMPWVSPLQKILASISGPVAKILGVLVIVVAGLGIAYGEAGSGMRKVFQIVLGLSIAFTATSLVTSLFGVSMAGV